MPASSPRSYRRCATRCAITEKKPRQAASWIATTVTTTRRPEEAPAGAAAAGAGAATVMAFSLRGMP
ncbi:hypothetical protein LUW76_04485 [Actinomadura madurae]|uniref:hypothetical protein n=1 Tax=Actinomadura madurae TaxID=1993 RepID=UPI002026EC74|nr:hypothetical protein [Actinomadura madurae]URM93634.1 hypothetical protein LUW76_04485 [Actinomadura madurae]